MSLIKTAEEITIMRDAGHILASILKEIESMIEVGRDVWDLEEKFLDLCKKNNVRPACKGYVQGKTKPFPTGLCVSINSDCVHCFPKKGVVLQNGDHILLDSVIELDGMYVDSAVTVGVGEVSEEKMRLLNTTKIAMEKAIGVVKDGARVGDISNVIQTIAEMAGYSVLREYTGHGIGRSMHERPSIPCWGQKGEGEILKKGMTITIEPLVASGSPVVIAKDGDDWETELKDGGNYCQFEHTVLIRENDCEILTKRKI